MTGIEQKAEAENVEEERKAEENNKIQEQIAKIVAEEKTKGEEEKKVQQDRLQHFKFNLNNSSE